MPRLEKLLSKFGKEERETIESLIEALVSLKWRGLDIKKLRGYKNFFRLRKGEIRIIFSRVENNVSIFDIGHRREDTYKLK